MSRTLTALALLLALTLPACATRWVSPVTATLDAPDGAPAALPGAIENGWAIVEATVNGQGPFRFVLDTGAEVSAISTGAALAAGLEPTTTGRLTDISGDERDYPVAFADAVAVGPLRMRTVPFVISDTLAVWTEELDIVGLLGYPGFDLVTLDLDYPAGVIRVQPGVLDPDAPGVTELRRTRRKTPEVRMTLLDTDAQPVTTAWFRVDSGGRSMIHLPGTLASTWTHPDLARFIKPGQGLSGVQTRHHTAPLRGPLQLAGLTVQRATAEIDAHQTLIGHDLLRCFRVRLDPRSGLAAFTPADPRAARVTAPQYVGIGVNRSILHDGGLSILEVAPGTPAARAGLRPNDLVLAIDAVPFGDPGFVDRTGWGFDPGPVTLTVDREGDVFDLTITPEPLFPADLDRLRDAGPDFSVPTLDLKDAPAGSIRFFTAD